MNYISLYKNDQDNQDNQDNQDYKFKIYKYKNIDINKISLVDLNIQYNNDLFYIQSPIFFDYELQNINSNKYIELKLEDSKLSHIKFLTFIDSIELFINNCYKTKKIKTQIITNIQNKKSLKAKLLKNTVYFDNNKDKIVNLYNNKISLLFKLECFNIYYSWNVIQILQLK